MRAVRVVLCRRSQTHLHIRRPLVRRIRIHDCAVLRRDRHTLRIGHRVAEKVRLQRRNLFLGRRRWLRSIAEFRKCAMQLSCHGIHQQRFLCGRTTRFRGNRLCHRRWPERKRRGAHADNQGALEHSLQRIEARYCGILRIRWDQGGVNFQSLRVVGRGLL